MNDQNIAPTEAASVQEQQPTDIRVKINSLKSSGPTLAYASVNLNGVFAARGIKIMKGPKGPFVSMPSYKTRNGYKDVCFPCTKEFREQLHTAVLTAYRQELAQASSQSHKPVSQEPSGPEMTM